MERTTIAYAVVEKINQQNYTDQEYNEARAATRICSVYRSLAKAEVEAVRLWEEFEASVDPNEIVHWDAKKERWVGEINAKTYDVKALNIHEEE